MAERGDESSEEEATISEDVVVTKYQMAAEIANRKQMTHMRLLCSSFVFSQCPISSDQALFNQLLSN